MVDMKQVPYWGYTKICESTKFSCNGNLAPRICHIYFKNKVTEWVTQQTVSNWKFNVCKTIHIAGIVELKKKVTCFEDDVLLGCDAMSNEGFPMFSSLESSRTTQPMTQHLSAVKTSMRTSSPHGLLLSLVQHHKLSYSEKETLIADGGAWSLMLDVFHKSQVKITHPNKKKLHKSKWTWINKN